MIGIKRIASYVPANALDNVEQASVFGETPEFVSGKIGALKLPRKQPAEETSDLAVEAVRALFREDERLTPEQVDAVFVVTQNGDFSGLPHTSGIVQSKLGLPASVAAFDISLGCSGYVYGLYALKGFMEASGLKNGLLITADPYSKIIDPADRTTAMLFGDAATATWMGEDPAWTLGPVSYGTDGDGAEALCVREGVLHMNGRQVFDFAATKVAPHIKALLGDAGYEISDIDCFCLHQGSAAIVDAIARRFKGYGDRFIKDIELTGNTVSSSIPLLLRNHVIDSGCHNVVLSGFGVGFSWASSILNRRSVPVN